MPDPSFSDLRVLIVDDNDHMRRLLRGILELLGIKQVRDVENGMMALNDSRLNLPDVIITDMMMSPVDGLEFSRMLRDDPTHPATRVPVLMITGYSEKHHVEAARDAGVTEFLAKPVTAEGVEARLRSVIENPRQFIRSSTFVGHDRRRRQLPVPEDEKRRAEDHAANTAFLAAEGRRFEDISAQARADAFEPQPFEPEISEARPDEPRLRRTLR